MLSSSAQSPLSSACCRVHAAWKELLKYTLAQLVLSVVQRWGWGRDSIIACGFQRTPSFQKADCDRSEVTELTGQALLSPKSVLFLPAHSTVCLRWARSLLGRNPRLLRKGVEPARVRGSSCLWGTNARRPSPLFGGGAPLWHAQGASHPILEIHRLVKGTN